jgi:uncharacterized protein (DUF433 family)
MEPAHDDNIPGAPCLDRITFEAGKMGGRACIRGLRITVGTIVSLVSEGADTAEILADYPDLEAEDIRQALAYAAWLAREEVLAGCGNIAVVKMALRGSEA